MRISDWSSDVCSSDLEPGGVADQRRDVPKPDARSRKVRNGADQRREVEVRLGRKGDHVVTIALPLPVWINASCQPRCSGTTDRSAPRSEEHTSELRSLMRI